MKAKLLLSTLVLGLSLVSFAVYAEEDELAKEEQALTEASAKDANFTAALKEKYQLTDEQIKSMQDQGLAAPHMAMTAQLAQSSGKPLDEVLKMRTEQKMGWGKIAKELGVHPGEIGKSVSSLRHDVNDKRKEARAEAKEERKAAKDERKAARREERQKRKEARQGKGKG